MRLLLDTVAFIWMAEGDSRLVQSARRLITDPANDVYLYLGVNFAMDSLDHGEALKSMEMFAWEMMSMVVQGNKEK